MKNRINFKNIKNKVDYLSIDRQNAISAEGVLFSVFERVKHEGDHENKIGTINKFSINKETMDIIAHTEHGEGRISYLYYER